MRVATILFLVAASIVVVIAFFATRRKGGIHADVDTTVAQGQFQFIALLDPAGKWTYPQVPGIPDWYFQTTGIRIVTTKPETKDADLVYMKSYNDALYQALKAQGKFHIIEENVARVKANLDKYKQSQSGAH